MATRKLTVTVPEELADYIRQQVSDGAYESVSAFMTRAASNLRDVDPLDTLIASMIAEAGPPDHAADTWLTSARSKAQAARSRTQSGEAAA